MGPPRAFLCCFRPSHSTQRTEPDTRADHVSDCAALHAKCSTDKSIRKGSAGAAPGNQATQEFSFGVATGGGVLPAAAGALTTSDTLLQLPSDAASGSNLQVHHHHHQQQLQPGDKLQGRPQHAGPHSLGTAHSGRYSLNSMPSADSNITSGLADLTDFLTLLSNTYGTPAYQRRGSEGADTVTTQDSSTLPGSPNAMPPHSSHEQHWQHQHLQQRRTDHNLVSTLLRPTRASSSTIMEDGAAGGATGSAVAAAPVQIRAEDGVMQNSRDLLAGLSGLRYLSKGAHACVYTGYYHGQHVAVKFLACPHLDAQSPVLREALLGRCLHHANVVTSLLTRVALFDKAALEAVYSEPQPPQPLWPHKMAPAPARRAATFAGVGVGASAGGAGPTSAAAMSAAAARDSGLIVIPLGSPAAGASSPVAALHDRQQQADTAVVGELATQPHAQYSGAGGTGADAGALRQQRQGTAAAVHGAQTDGAVTGPGSGPLQPRHHQQAALLLPQPQHVQLAPLPHIEHQAANVSTEDDLPASSACSETTAHQPRPAAPPAPGDGITAAAAAAAAAPVSLDGSRPSPTDSTAAAAAAATAPAAASASGTSFQLWPPGLHSHSGVVPRGPGASSAAGGRGRRPASKAPSLLSQAHSTTATDDGGQILDELTSEASVLHSSSQSRMGGAAPPRSVSGLAEAGVVALRDILLALGVGPGTYVAMCVMEFCSLGSLDSLCAKDAFGPYSRLPPFHAERLLVHIARHVAQGLAYLHAQGLVHGDIKPANVLLQRTVPQRSSAPHLALHHHYHLAHHLHQHAAPGAAATAAAGPPMMMPPTPQPSHHHLQAPLAASTSAAALAAQATLPLHAHMQQHLPGTQPGAPRPPVGPAATPLSVAATAVASAVAPEAALQPALTQELSSSLTPASTGPLSGTTPMGVAYVSSMASASTSAANATTATAASAASTPWVNSSGTASVSMTSHSQAHGLMASGGASFASASAGSHTQPVQHQASLLHQPPMHHHYHHAAPPPHLQAQRPAAGRGFAFVAKLADFGLSKLLGGSGSSSGSGDGLGDVGTIQYAAPERLGGGTGGTASDVYSFGILMYQMASGCRPFEDLNFGQIMFGVLYKELRPEWPEGRHALLQPLFHRCTAADPAQRPSAEQVVLELTSLERQVRARAREAGMNRVMPPPIVI